MLMTVTYYLDEAETARLDHLTALFDRATGKTHTPEQTFSAIMTTGCGQDISARMDYAEVCFSANLRACA